jgi:8-oxo-dGTP pyrophosphatase MutT (NUDIX family)
LPRVRRKILEHPLWELPAGGALPNESSQQAALRELREETGIDIRETNRLKTEHSLVVSPNRLPMFPHIFSVQITDQEYKDRLPHDDEVESVGRFCTKELQDMILNGEIITSITISILSRFLLSQRK